VGPGSVSVRFRPLVAFVLIRKGVLRVPIEIFETRDRAPSDPQLLKELKVDPVVLIRPHEGEPVFISPSPIMSIKVQDIKLLQ
jgi:hypothetical protein